ncbi:MAG: DUF359 domain-containing protein [Candidatus Methanomethylicia archaeon]|nr:DUF359 domain-containing protein [Candidatus Methanomethylicia archaeon]MDW7988791.1 DUF359 domain-containing protein [Nitrososphaerota archaeon]
MKYINESSVLMSKLILDRTYEDNFRSPYGILLKGDFNMIRPVVNNFFNNSKFKVTVGDYVTNNFLTNNMLMNVAIVDFKIERKQFNYNPFSFFKRKLYTKNPPGTITVDSWLTIQYAFSLQEHSLIVVDGEEDLLALPCVLCAPITSVIFFGIPKYGLMVVPVDYNAKDYALNLLKFFVPKYNCN